MHIFHNTSFDFLRWRWQAWRAGHPRPLQTPIPVVAPDLAFLHTNAQAGLAMQPAATWIGHITVLAQMGGLNILTDPVFSERCFPVQWAGPQRQTSPGLRLDQLPRIADIKPPQQNHGLDGDHRTGESQQPDRELLAKLGVPKLNHRRTQTKARALGKKTKQQAHAQTARSEYRGFTVSFIEACKIHIV